MATDVRIPTLGESVTDGVIVRWIKNDGDSVRVDEPLFELETDKANNEIPSPGTGVLKTLRQEGDTVKVGEVVARIDEGAAGEAAAARTPSAGEEADTSERKAGARTEPIAPEPKSANTLGPAVRRLVEEHQLEPEAIPATGRGGRLTKADVLAYLEQASSSSPETSEPTGPEKTEGASPSAPAARPRSATADEERVPMTRIRQRIAERLVQAQHTAAILTTFNEVDMSAVLDLRSRYRQRFSEKHGVGLGFMSFFARASIAALAEMPLVNAAIDATDIVYRRHVHLGIAVGTERGLVVPVVRNADRLSFAELEREIERLAALARQNRLGIDDLSGGTFTISNGGVYGSLLSTPILNPPQSAILGMHKIEKRPVVVDDEIVVRPMMYLALSYDHRLIDGANAVTFLVRVKESIEDPARLLLEV